MLKNRTSLPNGVEQITDTELLQLRKVLKENISKSLPEIDFITKNAEFRSIARFFYNQNYPNEYDGEDAIQNIIDPWLIYFQENDYEVSIRKVNISKQFEGNYSSIVGDIAEMESALISGNYARVTSLSITILTALYKTICDAENEEYDKNIQFETLYNLVSKHLKMNSKLYNNQEDKSLVRFCSLVKNLNFTLNNLRNLFSEAHGKSENVRIQYNRLSPHHFKLIVDSTKTIANFIIESYNFQKVKEDKIGF